MTDLNRNVLVVTMLASYHNLMKIKMCFIVIGSAKQSLKYAPTY